MRRHFTVSPASRPGHVPRTCREALRTRREAVVRRRIRGARGGRTGSSWRPKSGLRAGIIISPRHTLRPGGRLALGLPAALRPRGFRGPLGLIDDHIPCHQLDPLCGARSPPTLARTCWRRPASSAHGPDLSADFLASQDCPPPGCGIMGRRTTSVPIGGARSQRPGAILARAREPSHSPAPHRTLARRSRLSLLRRSQSRLRSAS